MNRKSRLKKRLEKKTQKNLFLGIIGIAAILFILIRFGIPSLANFTLFLSGARENNKSIVNNDASYIPPPILDSQFTATKSSELIINGRTPKKSKIHVFVNNEEQDVLDSQKNGTFSLKVNLSEGSNTIKAKSEAAKKQSNFSNILSVVYIKSEPTLTISSPADGDSFSKDQNKVNVSGKTDPEVTVTINNLWAIIDDNNNFSYELPLKDGDNQIDIIATDQAGNKTEKIIKVKYSQ